jgi:penicillin-binding protein 1A
MASALPRIKAQPIPGGYIDPAPPEPDPIGDLLNSAADALGMGQPPAEAAPAGPAPTPAPEPETAPF